MDWENLETDQICLQIISSLLKMILLNNFTSLHLHFIQGFNELCEFAGGPQMVNPLHSLWKLKQLWSTKLWVDLNDSNNPPLMTFCPCAWLPLRQTGLTGQDPFHLFWYALCDNFFSDWIFFFPHFQTAESNQRKLTEGTKFHKCLIATN